MEIEVKNNSGRILRNYATHFNFGHEGGKVEIDGVGFVTIVVVCSFSLGISGW